MVLSECICHVEAMQPSWFEEAHSMLVSHDEAPSGAITRTDSPVIGGITTVRESQFPLCSEDSGSWVPESHSVLLVCLSDSVVPFVQKTWLCKWCLCHFLVHSQGHPYVKCGFAFFGPHSLSLPPVSLHSVWPPAPLIMTMNQKFSCPPWFFNSCQ